jgi:hypothetical protein
MCGKNPYCNETDTDQCSQCYSAYLKEKDILYKQEKKIFVVGIPKYDWKK